MISSRAGLTALRRAGKPNTFFTANLLKASTASSSAQVPPSIQQQQTRGAATQNLSNADAQSILAKQRLQRPVSPHLTIYAKDQTWFGGSIWQRFTGIGFTGALYVYATAYLVAPLMGWHLESQSVAAAFATLPLAAKGGIKFFLAWPFVFHGFNGVKHLAYDMGKGFARTTIKKSGWYLWGASLVSSLYLAFLY